MFEYVGTFLAKKVQHWRGINKGVINSDDPLAPWRPTGGCVQVSLTTILRSSTNR